MLGLVSRLRRLGGPAAGVVLAVGVGVGTGFLATHAVLATWTYRDAVRRDLHRPGRWAAGVLVFGLVAFVPYIVLRRSSDGKGPQDAVPGAEGNTPAEGDAAVEAPPGATGAEGRSLAATGARGLRLGGRLLGRGARWAGKRAVRELAD